jgi:hypothetical protein
MYSALIKQQHHKEYMPARIGLTIALLSTVFTGYADAQTMYRCGTTYSQTPCGAGQKEIDVKVDDPCESETNRYSSGCIMRPSKPYSTKLSAAEEKRQAIEKKAKEERDEGNKKAIGKINLTVPDSALVDENKKTCVSQVTYLLKDPESAKFGNVLRMGAELDSQHGVPTPSVWYMVMVNAKNSYGGYTGSKSFICVFSTDEKKFMRAWSPS